MRQLPLPIGLDAPPCFDNFLAAGNEAAVAHLQALTVPAAPVYLWGAPGSGKSHLLKALCDRFVSAGGTCGWFTPESPAPWEAGDGWSAVVIDDCDRLGADAQHAAFSLFVQAASLGLLVAGAGRLPPIDLPLRDDLRSRLGWGHVFHLNPLDDNQTRAALRRAADRRGIALSDDVMHYLMTRFERDLSRQMALLDRLDAYSMSAHRTVTVPLLKQMLAESA